MVNNAKNKQLRINLIFGAKLDPDFVNKLTIKQLLEYNAMYDYYCKEEYEQQQKIMKQYQK